MYAEKIKEKKFPWGGKALVAAFPSKDVVSVVGSILGGSRAWGSEEEADVHAQMLLEGTKKSSKVELQKRLDAMGASLNFASGSERLYFIGKVRPVHLDALLALIAECLSEPAFPEPELAVLKMREAAELELESQNTYTQATTALTQMLYKKEHPNYGETTAEAVKILKGINAKHLRERHASLLSRKSVLVSLAGDVSFGKATALVSKHFKNLPNNTHAFEPFAASKPGVSKAVTLPIQNKASIDYAVGAATGINNDAKDYPALLLGLQILGNRGFASRLMKTVREEEGLTYGVYAYLAGMRATTDGYLYIWATFAPQLFEKGKESIRRQVDLLLKEGVTDEEVRKHRDLYVARQKVQLSNSSAFARAAHDTVADGKKLSFLDEFPKKVLKLSAKEVNAALKKYLVAEKLSEAAAGTFN